MKTESRSTNTFIPRTLLAIALSACIGAVSAQTNASSAAATSKRDAAAVQQEMQALGKRMAELSQELRAAGGGDPSAFSYTFRTDGSHGGTPKIRMFTRPGAPSGPALGVLLESSDSGAKIIGVTEGTGAEAAGLQVGDVLVSIDGKVLNQADAVNAVRSEIGKHKAGEKVRVDFKRGTQTLSKEVELKSSPRVLMLDGLSKELNLADLEAHGVRVESMESGEPGSAQRIIKTFRRNQNTTDLDLVTLNPDLASYFGTSTGVLAIKADGFPPLLSGDVIQRVNGQVVNSPNEVSNAMQNAGDTVQVEVIRQKTSRTLSVKVP